MMFWAPVPLKFTVLGKDEVTSSEPAVTVITLAIPKVELVDNCSDVPLIVTLKRSAVPLRVDVPVKVAVPAVAEKLPPTESADAIEKLTLVVIEPTTDSAAKLMVPAPEMVFEVPLIVIVPVLAAKLPVTDRFPVRFRDRAVLAEPVTVRLSNEIPEPLIVVPAPVIDSVPPEAWLNEPDPVVARLPVNVTLPLEKVTAEAAIVRLLKFCAPAPLTAAPEPEKVIVPVLPLNVPLLTQLLAMLCE